MTLPAVVPFALGTLTGALLWHGAETFPPAALTTAAFVAGVGLLFVRRWKLGAWRHIALFAALLLLIWASAAERSRAVFAEPFPAEWYAAPLTVELLVLARQPLAGTPHSVVAEVRHSTGKRWRARLRLPAGTETGAAWLPGERYEASVQLRPISGHVQPGAFDSEWWAFRQRLAATGSIRTATPLPPAPLSPALRLARWRAERAAALEAAAPRHGAWLRALALGDRSSFDETTWQRVQRTGTAHLVSISGMHVTLVAWLIGGGVRRLWQRSLRLTRWRPASEAGWFTAALVGWGYALVAGLGIPALRAALMLSVAAVAALSRVQLPLWGTLLAALALVLVVDPWAVGEAGFWLSFVAVGILIAVGRLEAAAAAPPAPALRAAVPSGSDPRTAAFLYPHWQRLISPLVAFLAVQGTITLALIPLTLLFFGQAALLGSLANLGAIPLIAWGATPLALLLLPWPNPWLAKGFAWLIDQTLALLAWAEHLPWAAITAPAPDPLLWGVAAVALGMALLFPPGLAPRLLALPALLLLFTPPPRPPMGVAVVTLLDVGQGQAIHIQTAHHDLLYDTGPAGAGWNAGEALIVPFLHAHGVKRLDGVIVSHEDRDHSGGLEAVARALPIGQLWWGSASPQVTLPASLATIPVRRCQAGETWVWDGVRFRFLWPTPGATLHEDNAASCVLLIETAEGARSVVSGDLPHEAEAQLLAYLAEPLEPRPTAVVAGHHGSKTSSSSEWVAAWRPHAVLFSVGAYNPFGHPDCTVIERWKRTGATLWRTDRDGALTVTLAGASLTVRAARSEALRYWRPPPALPACGRPLRP